MYRLSSANSVENIPGKKTTTFASKERPQVIIVILNNNYYVIKYMAIAIFLSDCLK